MHMAKNIKLGYLMDKKIYLRIEKFTPELAWDVVLFTTNSEDIYKTVHSYIIISL